MLHTVKTEAPDTPPFSCPPGLEPINWHHGVQMPAMAGHGRWDDGPPGYSSLVKARLILFSL